MAYAMVCGMMFYMEVNMDKMQIKELKTQLEALRLEIVKRPNTEMEKRIANAMGALIAELAEALEQEGV